MFRKTALALLLDYPAPEEDRGAHLDRATLLQAYLAEYQTITTRTPTGLLFNMPFCRY